ncbi:hypothetical protein NIES3804_10990 [Microcystis aeruginosa NIES-3804]|uniref:Uncharacterized protein n=1 Tax=Microcystis aeruginosa NIES-3804 TaxID=2517783 RepID=A0A6H9GGZ9_MICAE|nr:hypothetical protein NIES3804_10990 [Microcystis aeruginosa NIES-3804]
MQVEIMNGEVGEWGNGEVGEFQLIPQNPKTPTLNSCLLSPVSCLLSPVSCLPKRKTYYITIKITAVASACKFPLGALAKDHYLAINSYVKLENYHDRI